MEELNEKKHSFKMEDSTDRLIVKGEIIGESELEFYDDSSTWLECDVSTGIWCRSVFRKKGFNAYIAGKKFG
ncbi:hypothetical protein [Bacillus sp. V2I10]|uniref:hypothetical protein n=1 Tax=Bacillus sp. V2I10 TaxID=3042276 RepID=UPI00278ACC65|nr:hypothetical protein [Bacillus sp. V2I10]MDQ0862288.1 hypothetical protein [Bacillus sp. V2I10]